MRIVFCLFLLISKLLIFSQAPDLIWAKSIGGAYYDSGNKITVDNAGNSYTAGAFRDIVDFDPGSATSFLSSAGETDIFLVKLDPSGQLIWDLKFGGLSIAISHPNTNNTNIINLFQAAAPMMVGLVNFLFLLFRIAV